MIKALLALGLLSFAVACGSASEGAQTFDQNLMACTTTADCPAGSTCEALSGHATNVCKSADDGAQHDGVGGASGACPSGFELEVEHGVSSCKAHGGDAGAKGENENGDDKGHDGEAGANGDDEDHEGEGGDGNDNRGKGQGNDGGDTSDPNRGPGNGSGGSDHDNGKH